MARIGTIGGCFLAPGISKNNRLYTREHVARVVAKMQERLSDPNGRPIQMLTHHGGGDDSQAIAANVTGVRLDEAGRGWWDGDIINTAAGRDMAAATEPDENGKRALDGVSIRGWWEGPVRTVEHAGQTVTTADDLTVDGIDFTKSPGVEAARIMSTSLAESAGEGRVLVTEEAPAAEVTIEEAASVNDPDDEDDPKKPYGDVDYADPGYQDDNKKRYPINSAAHVRAAWSFINQDKNQEPYTAAQVKLIKGRIKSAAKKYGINVAAETAQTALDSVAEAFLSISAMQGPADVDIRAYGVDNADLAAAATKLGQAATAAVKTLDPDQDDDLDLGNGSTICGGCGMDDLPDDANYCPQCGTPLTLDDDDSHESERKEPGVSEQKQETPAAEQTAATENEQDPTSAGVGEQEGAEETASEEQGGLSESDRSAIVADVIAALDARKDDAGEPATETAPVEQPDVKGLMESFAAKVAETVEQKVAEARDQMRDEVITAYGIPPRKGLAEAAKAGPAKALHEMSDDERRAYENEVIAATFANLGQR